MQTNPDSDRPALRTILVLGECDRAEILPLKNWLNDRVGRNCRWVSAKDATNLSREFATGEFPELIVVFQSWSDQYSASEVNELLAFAPLARVVVCYGAWCESDGRNRQIWPMSVRVPIWAAQSRIDQECRLIQSPGEQQPIPWSASREEVFAADHPPIQCSVNPQSIYIDSPDFDYRRFVIELLTSAGHRSDEDNPAVLLFDADPWGPSRIDALEDLRHRFPQTRIFAITSDSQPCLERELHNHGVTKMLPKLGRWFQPFFE